LHKLTKSLIEREKDPTVRDLMRTGAEPSQEELVRFSKMRFHPAKVYEALETLDDDGNVIDVSYSAVEPKVVREPFYGDVMILDGYGTITLINEKLRERMRDPPLCVDLFCGAGGASLGMKWAGFKVVGVEFDKFAAATHQLNLDWTIRADVRQLPLRPYLEPDVVWFSAPCKDFSSLNMKLTQEGRKVSVSNYLVVVGAIQARMLHPKVVLAENVPLARKSWQWQAAMGILRDGGYSVRDYIVDAANYGVPQYRERVIMSASRVGPAPPPPYPTHGHSPKETAKIAARAPKKKGDGYSMMESRAAKAALYAMSQYEVIGGSMDAFLSQESEIDRLIQKVYNDLPIG
jgi:hypothetical protein